MEGQLTPPADSARTSAPLLVAARGISKQYPGVRALDGVDFELRAGEIHALMGENGAGKTTLIRIVTGATHPDAGTVAVHGEPKRFHSPADAQRAGIAAVYQEIDLIPQRSIAENIMLGREPTRLGFIRARQRNRQARTALRRVGLDLDLHRAVQSLPIAAQQMVAIARALDMRARVLVLDEPTSSLDAVEARRLFEILRRLKDEGIGIIFVTHFIEQVFAISDRITVLRNGARVGCFSAMEISRLQLVGHMLGRESSSRAHAAAAIDSKQEVRGEPIISARRLGRRSCIAPFDIELRPREVVGLAGLLGSGRSEAARLLFGADRADSGSIFVGGKRQRRPSPLKSLRAGTGMVPEDRKTQSLIPGLSLDENILLAAQAKRGWLRRIRRNERASIVERAITQFGIIGPGRRAPVAALSGGNQQKAMLARWLATDPAALILDEPTRGIDIGAKAEVEHLIGSLRQRGLALLFISAELDEVARASSRIIIVRDRRFAGELPAGSAAPERIMQAIAGETG
jgi:simple sugar transport system ATP-binding protein